MEALKMLNSQDIYIISTGIIMGTIARIATLKVDFRQVPSYPTAYFNNIFLGFVAATLGSVAIPAILTGDFVAVTFLTVAVQQFRDVRVAERESLGKLEHTEYTQRGEAYIDGIAKTFESRNYIALITSLVTVFVIEMLRKNNMIIAILCGVAAGAAAMILIYRFTKGKTVGEICDVSPGQIEVRGSELFVDGMYVTNYLGTDRSRELFLKEGIAMVLTPKDHKSNITLENYGQRQAILFEAVCIVGVKRYKFIRRNFETGKIIISFIPIDNDLEKAIKAVKHTPILENSRKIGRIMKSSGGSQDE
ncbi:YIEGIA domain-containing protein [Caproiciproducens galactitolivorans]|uniref:YIEGIA domain-containing protein n=1 Tax=Caproiciproducens galactitolivorans TaxID=642589 RepID=A0ABT4BU47_9FIRM|nr:YIEGIA domain-containing protein [Caproiciproducens galactitolivorans]MCY1714389.1 YIEGIA domain-containing protein [Caproiciproducens galactitolivorans]